MNLKIQINILQILRKQLFIRETAMFFKGNSDEDTPETNMFECPVIAKCIRINPIEWNHHISMRFDLMGCSLVTEKKVNLQYERQSQMVEYELEHFIYLFFYSFLIDFNCNINHILFIILSGQATQNAVTTAVPLVPTGGGVQTTSEILDRNFISYNLSQINFILTNMLFPKRKQVLKRQKWGLRPQRRSIHFRQEKNIKKTPFSTSDVQNNFSQRLKTKRENETKQ
ncbi:hypothetical protein KUTeg_006385 [Tegillarca granosa]|uniref:F5/8 type C domain-containing protein n=1 Tax=Tegillarca granosa TaxID=220873 RepID=A0ABQ9FGC3_TEGGR|nr:hypothetical protein KUTeg_006385 [Tegillarca granosa]